MGAAAKRIARSAIPTPREVGDLTSVAKPPSKSAKSEREDDSCGGLLEGIGPTTLDLRFSVLAHGAIRDFFLALRGRMRRNTT
jgi:hypothetical protein